MGARGVQFVAHALSTRRVGEAVGEVQERGGLGDPRRTGPLLLLLEALGLRRAEVHRRLLDRATRDLMEVLPALSQKQLLAVLKASFPYIGIPQLRDVPQTIIHRLRSIPRAYLKSLSTDPSLFRQLSPGVQSQVFEADVRFLLMHAMPLVHAYAGEKGTKARAVQCLWARRKKGAPPPSRKAVRGGSEALGKLAAMVGPSPRIYGSIVKAIVGNYRDSEGKFLERAELSYCALRSQLLMGLHDRGQKDVCAQDPCHKLAWCLDACLRDVEAGREAFTDARLRELHAFFQQFETQREAKKAPAGNHHQGSSSNTFNPDLFLGEAGMILRSPEVFHLLGHEALRMLAQAVGEERLPRGDKKLAFIARLIALASGSQAMLREGVFVFQKEDPALLQEPCTVLAAAMADVLLRQARGGAAEELSFEVDARLAAWLPRSPAARLLAQVYALQRLAARDFATAAGLLATLFQCAKAVPDKALVDWHAFGTSLAKETHRLVRAKAVQPGDGPGSSMWKMLVDCLLMRLVDSGTEAHVAVLKVLLEASGTLSNAALAEYLELCLKRTKKSRKRHKKRERDWAAFAAEMEDFFDERPAEAPPEDGVHATYVAIVDKFKEKLSEEAAPALFEYVNAQP